MLNQSKERFTNGFQDINSTLIQHHKKKNNFTNNIQNKKLSLDKQNIDSGNIYSKKIRNESVYYEQTSVEISHIDMMSEEYQKNDDYEHEMIENLNVIYLKYNVLKKNLIL